MNITVNTIAFLVLAAAITYLSSTIAFKPLQPALGSVARGGEYTATSTNTFTTSGFGAETVLLSTNGTLGSVVITGANTGTMNFYDATTSNTSQRASSMSTTSILVASFPASTAAGTYTFDRSLVNGLYVSISGIAPTSTITYRVN